MVISASASKSSSSCRERDAATRKRGRLRALAATSKRKLRAPLGWREEGRGQYNRMSEAHEPLVPRWRGKDTEERGGARPAGRCGGRPWRRAGRPPGSAPPPRRTPRARWAETSCAPVTEWEMSESFRWGRRHHRMSKGEGGPPLRDGGNTLLLSRVCGQRRASRSHLADNALIRPPS